MKQTETTDQIIYSHPWEPFVPAGARILVMGTFPPGDHRWAMDFYYPNPTNDFWKMMASGNYTVDEKTKAEAQQAISEDGFWGVKNTSQRIFDFASALAGDDPEKMKKFQAAVEKGFSQAEDAWGGSLPSICGDTHEAVNKLFDDYYAQHKINPFHLSE